MTVWSKIKVPSTNFATFLLRFFFLYTACHLLLSSWFLSPLVFSLRGFTWLNFYLGFHLQPVLFLKLDVVICHSLPCGRLSHRVFVQLFSDVVFAHVCVFKRQIKFDMKSSIIFPMYRLLTTGAFGKQFPLKNSSECLIFWEGLSVHFLFEII